MSGVGSARDGGPAPVLASRPPAGWRLYAERPRRRGLQLAGDLAVAAWAVAVLLLAMALHDLVMTLQAPARGLAEAGVRVRDVFSGAAGVAADVPFVGDRLAGALGDGVTSGDELVAAGEAQAQAVATAATASGWLLAVLLLLPVVPWWLTLRLRWVLRARAVLALRNRHHGADLLALRTLVRGSPARVTRRVPGAVDGWRHGDPAVLDGLAAMELGRLGLRPGRTGHTAPNGPGRPGDGQGETPPPPGRAPPRGS